jgi:hypothetical protein
MKTLALALVLLLAGCSAEVNVGDQPEDSSGQPSVDRAELEQEVSDQLERTVGQAPDRIDCPGDLTGEVGIEMRCVLHAGPDRLGVTVTVTAVEGEQVDFDIEVDEEMME